MQILIGYIDSSTGKSVLSVARDYAEALKAKVFIITSMEGGGSDTNEKIRKFEKKLEKAQSFIEEKGLECESHQVVKGRSPGEDIVWFAKEYNIDLVFMGIEKKSKTQKILLGSTAQYVILKAPCPVLTVK